MRSASERRRVAALVVPAWSIAVALSVPLVVQGVFDRSHVLTPLHLVESDEGANHLLSCGIFNRTFAVYSSLVSFFIPLAVMIVADFRSVQILRKNIRFPPAAMAVAAMQSWRPRTLRTMSDRSGVDDVDDCRSTPVACVTAGHAASSDATSTVSAASPGEVFVTQAAVQHRLDVESLMNNNNGRERVASSVGCDSNEHLTTTTTTTDTTINTGQQTPSTQSSFVYRGRSRSKSMVYLDMLASCGRSTKVNSRERRAEKTLIWVFAAFVALWLPFFCANLAYGACGGDGGLCDVPPRLFAAFTWLGYMSSGVNPCIYTLLNRDFRVAFRHLLTCRPSRLRTASASAMAATLRANSVRFTRTASELESRRRAGLTAAAAVDSALDATQVVVTPSFP